MRIRLCFLCSMACVSQDAGEPDTADGDINYNVNETTFDHRIVVDSDTPEEVCNAPWTPNIAAFGHGTKPIGWMDGLLGCMRPVMSLLVKSSTVDIKVRHEEWEIPFEHITNLEWLGSGAQGTVFSGYLRGEIVAVKKVRDIKETDIKHLRKLDHENIIKFK